MTFIEKFSVAGIVFWILLTLFLGVGYVRNIVKLIKLDFKEPFKAEVIRGVGIFPPVGVIVGWIKIEDK